MPIFIMDLFSNLMFIWIIKILVFILTALFIIYYFSKEGRDERGRSLIASSCVRGIVVFFILLNLCGYYTNYIVSDLEVYTSAITITYDVTLLTILINIAILRKIR